MRIAVDQLGREAGAGHHGRHLHVALVAGEVGPEDLQGLGDGIADGHARIEAGQGVLEDDLHVLARRPQGLALSLGDVAAHQGHGPVGGLDQVQHGPRQGGLAATALAHHAQGLPLAHLEGDAVHGPQLALAAEQALSDGEPDLHVLGLDDDRGVGRHGGDHRSAAAIGTIQARNGVKQIAGIGGLRRREDLPHRAFLHVLAVLHHADAVGQSGDDAHVVGDQDHGRARLAAQLGHQVEDLGLDGDIEGGGGLIGDQQFGPTGHGLGDHHPLAHAARKLVRILLQPARRIRDAHLFQPFPGPAHGLGGRQPQVQAQGLGDLLADPHVRGERRQRVLEDHGHLRAADAVQRLGLQPQDLLTLKPDRARGPAVLGQQSHDRHEGLALARAAFAHHAQGFAPRHLQADAAHGVDLTIMGVEGDLQIIDRQDGGGGWGSGQGRTPGFRAHEP